MTPVSRQVQELCRGFPRLAIGRCIVTSPETTSYNCIAWAAADTARWWWPTGRYYWPPGAQRTASLKAFEEAFATLGFRRLQNPDADESTVEMVAIYARPDGIPTHAARQLPSGRWTSKCGAGVDIEHELDGLEGDLYGSVVLVLGRPRE